MTQVKQALEAIIKKAEDYDDDELLTQVKTKVRLYVINMNNDDYEKCVNLIRDGTNADDILQQVFEGKIKGAQPVANVQKEQPKQSDNVLPRDPILQNGKQEEPKLNRIDIVPKEERKQEVEIINNINSVPVKEEKQKEVTILIKVSNSNFYEKLIKKKDEVPAYNFNMIMQRALSHVREMIKNKSAKTYFEKKEGEKELLLFRIFEANKFQSGGGKDINLLPDNFEYRLLPNTIKIIAKTEDEKLLLNTQTKVKVVLENDGDGLDEDENLDDEKEQLYFRRFKCFLRYFQDKPYSLINKKSLEKATNKTITKYNGIEPFMTKFQKKMNLFASKCYSTPKGILLYGPPGTGKSAITKTLCEELGVVFATAPMAAGDLKKGIVGDSEKTINEIAMRCKLVPWEMCVLLIDEIDSLAPDRTAENASTGSQDLIGVLLATMDGSKETKNMKIIASTNLLNKIDAAFLRRMEIQLFLGNPNKSSRVSWIKAKIKQSEKDVNFERVRRFAEDEEFEGLRDFVVYSTMNFSADAYRKLLDRFYHALLTFEAEDEEGEVVPQEPEYKDYKALLEKKILGVSEEMKIYLKGSPVLSIINASEKLCYNEDFLDILLELAEKGGFTDSYNRDVKASRKVLIDLSTERNKQRKSDEDNFQEVFQVPCRNENRLTNEEQEALLKLKTALQNLGRNTPASYYLFAILYFSEVSHITGNTDLSNYVRDKLLRDQSIRVLTGLLPKNSLKERLLDHPDPRFVKDCEEKVITLARGVNAQPHNLLTDFLQSVDTFYDPMPLKILQLLQDSNRYQHDWLPLIVKFALNYDADIVKMIDNNFIINSSALDDSAATTLISNMISETNKYDKSVIIFDLDSISQIKKEYQALKQDIEVSTKIAIERGDNEASFCYTLQRPQTFQTILDILRTEDSERKCWFFAVSKHPKIVFDFKEALKWPPTPSVTKFEQEEIRMEKLYRCLHCNEIFNERQNRNEFKCYRHTQDWVLFDNPKKPVGSNEKPKLMELKRAREMIEREHDIFDMHFKYICCGTVLGGKGHEPFKHEEGEEIEVNQD